MVVDLRPDLPPHDAAVDEAVELVTDLAVSDFAWTSRWADGCAIVTKGNGFSFALQATLAVQRPGQVVSFDFNRDGLADVAVPGGQNNDQVYVFLANGNGVLRAPTLYPVPAWLDLESFRPEPLALGDFDNDGAMDLVLPGYGPKTTVISVLLGVGDGTFKKPVTGPMGMDDTCPGFSFNSLAPGRLNQDAFLDLLVASHCSQMLFGDGKGGLTPAPLPMRGLSAGLGNYPWFDGAALGDVNGDGALDLWWCDPRNHLQYFELGVADGGFAGSMPIKGACQIAAFRDFNRDGRLDVVWGGGVDNVQLGNGDGTFQAALSGAPSSPMKPFDVNTLETSGGGIPAADLDGDGILDLFGMGTGTDARGNETHGYLAVSRGRGDGTFFPPYQTQDDPPLSGPWTIAVGDFDGDCRPDLALSDRYNNRLQIFLNTTP